MNLKLLAVLAFLLLAGEVRAEELRFQLFTFDRSGQRVLLSEGHRSYVPADVVSTSLGWGDNVHYRKELTVSGEFSVGASVFPEAEITGFGLWMRKQPEWYEFWSDGGFSWEWFDQEVGTTFRKRQGSGKVTVTFASRNRKFELTSVEFLEDATLRLKYTPWFFFASNDTHLMVIRAGSVFRFAP